VVYWIKRRPGLEAFLRSAAEMYELHVDTAATRTYALAVMRAIDPDGSLFGDRVVSRCDTRRRSGAPAARRARPDLPAPSRRRLPWSSFSMP
jgi:TFIIF-interacting CTD phosphatase-like protein